MTTLVPIRKNAPWAHRTSQHHMYRRRVSQGNGSVPCNWETADLRSFWYEKAVRHRKRCKDAQRCIFIGSRSDGNFIIILLVEAYSFRKVAERAPFLFHFSHERTMVSVLRPQELISPRSLQPSPPCRYHRVNPAPRPISSTKDQFHYGVYYCLFVIHLNVKVKCHLSFFTFDGPRCHTKSMRQSGSHYGATRTT